MSSRYTYTSINRIFSKLIRDVTDDFSETDVIEWCGEALEAIGSVKSYEEDVFFSEVKNHQCTLPKGLHAIIQIARDREWSSTSMSADCTTSAVKSCNPDFDFAAFQLEETVPGSGKLSYVPKFGFDVSYRTWTTSTIYRSRYVPVRLATSTLFNTLVCTEKNNMCTGNSDEYTIVMGDTVRFSFEKGFVAIPYLKQAVDKETGYPLVPDTYSHTTAITKYITMKMMERQCFNGREGACGKADKLAMDWQWYCSQAGNIDMMPHGIDEHQNLLDQRSYFLPRQNRYYGFFGNLSQPENRVYNNPNRRYSY
jgi:hypothetical protein